MKKIGTWLLGIIAGLLNGLFGAGGGIAVVPMLEHLDLSPQKSHATSVAIILPLSIASTIAYLTNQVPIHWQELLWLIPFGIVGAVIGSKILPKINSNLLRKIFAVIIVYAGIRLFLRSF